MKRHVLQSKFVNPKGEVTPEVNLMENFPLF